VEGALKKILFMLIGCLFLANVAHAQEAVGTPEEAEALVKKAVAYYKQVGKDKAVEAFYDTQGQFVNKDLYIFIYDTDGVMVMHPYLKPLVGKNSMETKDPDGKAFIKEMVEKAKADNSGTIEYKYAHPQKKKIVPKGAYFERVDNVVIASAYLK
jgi:signal transduction histidine kinase